MRGITFAVVAGLLLLAGPAAAQTTGPETVRLAARPAPAPTPALRVRLLPEVRELRPGNAALFYQRAHSPDWIANVLRSPDAAHFHEWLQASADPFPAEKIRYLKDARFLEELDLAARMESCDWQLLERARTDGPNLLLPDLQSYRTLAVMLALRARLEMRDGALDKAAATLRTGFAMSKHVGEAPTLINYLVGATIAHFMLGRVEELIQQPGGPNLYWALTDLPAPLLDLRRPAQGERVLVDSLVPEVRRALEDPRHPAVAAAALQASMDKLARLPGGSPPNRQAMVVAVTQSYPRARQALLGHGYTAERLDALPVTQVVLTHALLQYDEYADDAGKLLGLPFWEARPFLAELKEKHEALNRSRPTNVTLVLPLLAGPAQVYATRARLQRRVELLRCVEAIRLYAAGHAGAAPETLEDIREVPVPRDPMTGNAFVYHRERDHVVLEAPPPPGEEASPTTAVRMDITLHPARKE